MDIDRLLDPELGAVVSSLVDSCLEVYLVGGVIRDYLLRKKNSDVDFVVKQNAITAARKTADAFKGKFYVLDDERGTGRALIEVRGENLIVDFATINGDNIQDDLRKRDFTINAVACDIRNPTTLVDPLHGEQDLNKSVLKPCSPLSFALDPVRIIRAVRFIQSLDFHMSETNMDLARQSVSQLCSVSAERKRDEIFHIFETKDLRHSLELMRKFGLWADLFPHLSDLEEITAFPPHMHNALDHTLCVLDYCQMFMQYIETGHIASQNHFFMTVCDMLDEFKTDLRTFIAEPIHPQRKYDGLLYLACLYHDISKVGIKPVVNDSRVSFPQHSRASSRIYKDICPVWALSTEENRYVERLIGNHTVPKIITDTESEASRRALFCFYRMAGPSGVLISLHNLADILATYEHTLSEKRWTQAVQTSHALLDSWFNKYDQIIEPSVLLDGEDLKKELKMNPGKAFGEILEGVKEAQAGGLLYDRETALIYAEKMRIEKGL